MASLKKFAFIPLFLILYSMSAFGTWVVQTSTAQNLNAITGISSANITNLCAVGENGTIIISNNYGNTWQTKNSATIGTINLSATCFAGGDLWVAGSAPSIKPFVSSDGGNSWQEKSNGIVSSGPLFDIIFDPTYPNNGMLSMQYGASQGKIYYTINRGANWSAANFGGATPVLRAMAYSGASGTFWAVGDSGNIWKSDNYGASWSQKAIGLTSKHLKDICFTDPNHGFIVGDNYTFLYTTDGDTWKVVTTSGLPGSGVFFVDNNTGWACLGTIIDKINGSGTIIAQEANYAWKNFLKLFFFDADNGFVAGRFSGGDPNINNIYAQITPIAISSVVRKDNSSNQAPQGFSGDLIITGTNFQIGTWSTSNVTFPIGSGISANSVIRNNSSQLTVNVSISNSATAGPQTVTLTNIDNSTATGSFTVNALPTITSIDPSSSTQGTSSTLLVKGTGFQDGITANFGSGITSSVTYQSTLQLSVSININASAATGPRTITFTNPDGGSVNSSFTISSATAINPAISSVSPSNVVQGTINQDLIITGSNFESGATVMFSGSGITINSPPTFNSSSQLTVNISVAGNAATGQRSITITNPTGGSGSANNLFYITTSGIVNPTISSVSPSLVYRGTAQIITINGTGFKDGAAVSFIPSSNIIINSNTFKNAGQIEVLLTADLAAALGRREVGVTNPDGGHGSLADAVEIIAQNPPPVITDFVCYPNPYNPNAGQPATLQFFLTQNALVEVTLIDISGAQKMSFTTNATVGYNKIFWYGKDYNGNLIGNGAIMGLIKTDGKLQKQKFKIMIQSR